MTIESQSQNYSAKTQAEGTHDSKKIKLIPRERQCLYWAAQGKTVEETAMILAIKATTVRSYLQQTKYKLGVYKITQAINKAIKLQII